MEQTDVGKRSRAEQQKALQNFKHRGQSYFNIQKNEAECTSWQEELHKPMSEENGEIYFRPIPFEARSCDCMLDVGQCLCRFITNKTTFQPYVVIKLDDTEYQSHDIGDVPEDMCHILYEDLKFQAPYDGQRRLKISVLDVDIGVDRLIGKVYVDLPYGEELNKTDFSKPKYAVHKLIDQNGIFGGTVVFSIKIDKEIDNEIEVQIHRLEHVQESMIWSTDEDGSEAWKGFIFFLVYIFVTAGIMGYIESWQYPDALWFKIITVVGVGYGDFYPTTDAGMLVNALFICCDVMLLGYTITIVFNYILMSAIKPKPKFVGSEKQQLYRILVLGAFCFVDVLVAVVVFWTFEDWTFIRSLHFCVVTLSTVGYGDISPTKTGTKIFCCFYILTIVLSVVRLLSMMSNYASISGRDEKVKKAVERSFQLVEILDSDGDGMISRYEYLSKMLVFTQLCNREEILQLMTSFDEVDVSGDGIVTIDEIKQKYSTKGHTQYHFGTQSSFPEAEDLKKAGQDHVSNSNHGGEDFSLELMTSKRSPEVSPGSEYNHA